MKQAVDHLNRHLGPRGKFPFASVIVNHTLTSRKNQYGTPICYGYNKVSNDYDPTAHGEIVAIRNCTSLTKNMNAVSGLSLYTTAEPCPMCTSAIIWSDIGEIIFGTSIRQLIKYNWAQIDISAKEFLKIPLVNKEKRTKIIGGVLKNETDTLFEWQFTKKKVVDEVCSVKY
ncbi:hypothetical protein G9A89_016958 [Geosiphon pyriformis]|nr:hypothetical protein G9A89_016958 [Geosiphon pyriformis]